MKRLTIALASIGLCFCFCFSGCGKELKSREEISTEICTDESGIDFLDEEEIIDLDGNATVFYEIEGSEEAPYFKLNIKNDLECGIIVSLDDEKILIAPLEESIWVYREKPLSNGKHTLIFMAEKTNEKLKGQASLSFSKA